MKIKHGMILAAGLGKRMQPITFKTPKPLIQIGNKNLIERAIELLIKHGVWEHEEMKYPWFAPKMQIFDSGEVQDMCGEDVSFCLDAKEAGFEIWCDPRVRVGHEKTRVI